MTKVKVGIINVTGYSGSELARILHHHPEVEITSVTGRSAAGQRLGEVFPHLDRLDLTVEPELSGSLDLVFSALPHKASAEAVIPALEQGMKVVDISADFRLKLADEYEKWYEVPHQDPTYLEEAVYGLTELHRDDIKSARLVANPGCYPTSAILALAPAVSAGIIGRDIIVDSMSGVSGGGRTLNMTNHFSEVNENVFAYRLGRASSHAGNGAGATLNLLAEEPVKLSFHRHQLPGQPGERRSRPSGAKHEPDVRLPRRHVPRRTGCLSVTAAGPDARQTAAARRTSGTLSDLRYSPLGRVYRVRMQRLIETVILYYADHPFVRVTNPPSTHRPSIRLGNNWCLIACRCQSPFGVITSIRCTVMTRALNSASGLVCSTHRLIPWTTVCWGFYGPRVFRLGEVTERRIVSDHCASGRENLGISKTSPDGKMSGHLESGSRCGIPD